MVNQKELEKMIENLRLDQRVRFGGEVSQEKINR